MFLTSRFIQNIVNDLKAKAVARAKHRIEERVSWTILNLCGGAGRGGTLVVRPDGRGSLGLTAVFPQSPVASQLLS